MQAIFSITVLLIVLISPTGSLWGAEFCVDDASALQTALSTAASNDEDNIIKIARGITYVGNFFYATDKGKEIIIRGGYDKSGSVCTFPTTPSSPSETILDGNGAGRVLRVSDDGDGNIVVERLNLRNGNSTGDGGGLLASSINASGDSGDVRISYNIIENNQANRMGGAWIDSYSSSGNSGSVSVTDNIIRNNSAINDYGGINARSESALNQSSTVTISDNIITNNTATNGFSGGVCTHSEGDTGSGTVTLSHNTITSNSSEGVGGGAYIYSRTISGPSGGIFLTNNMVAENNSNGYGGGLEVFCSGSPGTGGITLTNNTVAANSADVSSGGARLYGPGLSGTLNVYNNIFWGNTAPIGRDIEISGFLSSNGYNNDYAVMTGSWNNASNNINQDPLFIGGDNYHLRSHSPCRDKGTPAAPALPATDIDGEDRILGNAPDMGADELALFPWLLFTPAIIGDAKPLKKLPCDATSVNWIQPYGNVDHGGGNVFFHDGIDFGTKSGGQFFSCAKGLVTGVALNTGQGWPGTNYRITIQIDSDIILDYHFEIGGNASLPERQANIFVTVGDHVTAGQHIANLIHGNDQNAADVAHVHWGIYGKFNSADCPLDYFTRYAATSLEALYDSGIEKRPSYRVDLCE